MKLTIRLMKKGVGVLCGAFGLIVVLILLLNCFIVIKAKSDLLLPYEVKGNKRFNDVPPVLVLGAGVINNQKPSCILQKRLDAVQQINNELADVKYIMSGDHREDNYNEVGVMKKYLVDNGLDSSAIYLDHAGYSTYDSLYRLKHVFGIDKAYIVTQAYHLPRALMIAEHLDIQAQGIVAEDVATTRIKREIREVAARVKDFVVCLFNLDNRLNIEMDYLIDLNQSGDRTNNKEKLATNDRGMSQN